jgi:hypothetical protein
MIASDAKTATTAAIAAKRAAARVEVDAAIMAAINNGAYTVNVRAVIMTPESTASLVADGYILTDLPGRAQVKIDWS